MYISPQVYYPISVGRLQSITIKLLEHEHKLFYPNIVLRTCPQYHIK